MKTAAYRRLRTTVGALVLAGCALAFADIGDWVSAAAARVFLWPQFTPSLLDLLRGAGWISAGCVAVIALTLLFGRVYCAMLCPLGVLMDLAARLARRTGKKRKLSHRPGRPVLRAASVAVCAAGLLAGTAAPLGLLDPYSLFGKIVTTTLRPLLGAANHLAAATGLLPPVDLSPTPWTAAAIGLGLLAFITALAVRRGRLWCNTACPVGAVLGLFSRHALFRLGMSNSACVACSLCERVCPAQCVDYKKFHIDHSRCIMCLDCATLCKKSGISLMPFWRLRPVAAAVESAAPSAPVVAPHAGRRAFLASTAALPAAALAGAGPTPPSTLSQHNKPAVLPPGAVSLAHFQSHCTACQLCVANCPDQVLRPSVTEHGLAGFLQPYQDFDVAFCSYNCSNCSQVCPTGAIRPVTVEERRLMRTGVANFFIDRCVVNVKGTSCGACSEHCPTQAVHMIPWKNGLTIPEVDPKLCVGCGGCEFICPVRPDKAIVVAGLSAHERADPVVRGTTNSVREIEEEFPF